MKKVILTGAGGCMRELVWQMQEKNKQSPDFEILGYVDLHKPENGEGLTVGGQTISYLGDDDVLLKKKEPVNVMICVGEPALRRRIAEKLSANPQISFPNIILGNTKICADVQMGKGCIASMDTRISTNVTLGDFVFLNTGSMVCHDGRLGDFVTLGPDVTLAGDVRIGDGCNVGIGTKIIQGVSVCADVTVGAGAVVVRDVAEACTVAGVPAKRIR